MRRRAENPVSSGSPGLLRRARWGKLLGVAGIVGVAATGVLVARDQRQRAAYAPEEVRARLHARLDQADRPA
jgi:hypothetical protein